MKTFRGVLPHCSLIQAIGGAPIGVSIFARLDALQVPNCLADRDETFGFGRTDRTVWDQVPYSRTPVRWNGKAASSMLVVAPSHEEHAPSHLWNTILGS